MNRSLVADALADGRLEEPFPELRMDGPGYWFCAPRHLAGRGDVERVGRWLSKLAKDAEAGRA